MNKEKEILENFKHRIESSIFDLKREFQPHYLSFNLNNIETGRDYGEIARRIVMLQECLEILKYAENEIEEKYKDEIISE